MNDFRFSPYRREYGVLIPAILNEYTMHEVYQPPANGGIPDRTTTGTLIDYSQVLKIIPKSWYKYFMDKREHILSLKGIRLYDTPRQAMTAALRDKLAKSGAVRCTVTSSEGKGVMLSGYYKKKHFNSHPEFGYVIVLADDVTPELLESFNLNTEDFPTKDISYFELAVPVDEILVAEVEQI